jgi:predicted nucleic acid-binding protein
MTRRPAPPRRSRTSIREAESRYTIDASVFVNAFNLHERGHAESLQVLTTIQEQGAPIIVPTLLIAEIASAVARASDDSAGALEYANATAALTNVMLVGLSPTLARQAAELAATHRLRGADAVYLAVARRYATILISRDDEQLARGSRVAICHTPERALRGR